MIIFGVCFCALLCFHLYLGNLLTEGVDFALPQGRTFRHALEVIGGRSALSGRLPKTLARRTETGIPASEFAKTCIP